MDGNLEGLRQGSGASGLPITTGFVVFCSSACPLPSSSSFLTHLSLSLSRFPLNAPSGLEDDYRFTLKKRKYRIFLMGKKMLRKYVL
jgi:hypothetical protein